MTAQIIAIRTLQIRRDHVASGALEHDAERLAVDEAASEHRTYVRQVIGYFLQAVDLGASEDEALCLTERLFASRSTCDAERKRT